MRDYDITQQIIERTQSVENSSMSLEEKSKKINEIIEDYSIRIFDIDEVGECIKKMVLSCMEELNIDEDYYKDIHRCFCFREAEAIYSYKDSRVERYSEEDIKLNEHDLKLANECIKNGIEYCAYYIANNMIARQFMKDPIPLSMKEHMLERNSGGVYAGKGDKIESITIAIFIKSLIKILNDEYKEKIFGKTNMKNIFIGALGADHFEVTKGKKYIKNGTRGPDGYFLALIDNDCDAKINKALKKAGLSGMFNKEFNKRRFYVKDKRFGYISMNSGHWITEFDAISNQKLEEYKNEVISKLISNLPAEEAKSIIMYLKNDDSVILNSKNTRKNK